MTELQRLYQWLDALNRYPVDGDDEYRKIVQRKIEDIQRGV